MRYATPQAYELIREYTRDPDLTQNLELYLSEAPIGDEYGTMSDEEWKRGNDFAVWAWNRGVDIWSPDQ
jgi:hypothetical protein